ncbi:MAG: AAA family ATPase [Verrucomicrobiota bacterium]|nr:AAA family ATPase [Verrucomicrobiota bacterium]
MNKNRQPEPSPGMTLGDIYYVIFRHKWKIILFSLAGIAAAVAVYFFKPPPYESQAELLIKYVPEAPTLALAGDKVIIPDSQGNAIINSEIQILTSLDLAEEAATNIGPSNILVDAGGGNNPVAAAVLIREGLQAVPADKGSSVIVVSFQHPNAHIVQPVLQEIINDYFQKHYDIHSASGQYDDALSRERSALTVQLSDTEQQLAALKNKANILSLDGSQAALASQIAKIQDAMLDAQAQLAGYQAAFKEMGKSAPAKIEATNAPTPVPPGQMDDYQDLCARLDLLRKKEQGYFAQGFTTNNVLIAEVDGQISGLEKTKINLEKKYPQLSGMNVAAGGSNGSASASGAGLQGQVAQVAALQARIKAWDAQLDQLQTQATNLNNIAPTIAQLEQTKQIQATNLQSVSISLQQAQINAALETGKAPNIKWVQAPSPPFQDWKNTHKLMAGLAFGGIIAGLALAFFLEFYLDPSIKRPVEIESKLKLPLFLSIPDVSRNGHARLARSAERRLLKMSNSETDTGAAKTQDASPEKNGELKLVSLEKNPALQPFYEALRDRLVVYFEVRNLTHKPKLVAVTGTEPGSGVSTVAAGLAASLSETGDGNVLLVDMNLEGGAAQQFYKGKAACGMDTALADETKENAMVQENLYVVSGETNLNSDKLPRILPKRFAALVPKLKASDFDYIIFDMPPVTQTSITARLAGFMDMVLLVIESEKSNREVVRRANDWLTESGATVSAVLNKARKYVPERLHREFLSDK